jgi:O-methyltransferase involved in polyketide biosynthesis
VRKNRSSLTAEDIAIARAVESEKPADEQICYDPDLISLFIWQGVTMYLTPAGVDTTLAFIEKTLLRVAQLFLIMFTRLCWMASKSKVRSATCAAIVS